MSHNVLATTFCFALPITALAATPLDSIIVQDEFTSGTSQLRLLNTSPDTASVFFSGRQTCASVIGLTKPTFRAALF